MKSKAAYIAVLIVACLILCVPLAGTAQDPIDREIVIMFKPGIIRLPAGQIRASIASVNMPSQIRAVLQNAGALEMALGMPSFQSSDTLRVLADGRVFRLPDYTNLFVVSLQQTESRSTLIDSLKVLPFIISVEKNQKPTVREFIPNDTHFAKQWNMRNTGQSGGTTGADIKATPAWDFTTGNSSVILGIVDAGIQANHEDLTGRVSGDAGFGDPHGTHVAGIAGAKGNNNKGVAGVNWNAQLVSQRMDLGGTPEMAQAVNAAVAAGARVLNNSWGIVDYSQVLYDAFFAAQQADVLSVVANPESGVEGEFPNSFAPWIFNVGATTDQDAKATYSFERNYTDVAAPGGNLEANHPERDILSTVTYNTALGPYDYLAGTSMAAPHATGIAGLLLSINPSLHNYDLEWILKRSADDKGATGRDPSYGYGRVNAYEAVRHVASPYFITHGNSSLAQTYNNVQRTFLDKPLPELAAGVYWCDVYKLEAALSFSPPYGETPWAWLSQTGYSGANPNDAKEYMLDNSTTTSSTVRTFFYYIRKNNSGQTINKWAPTNPNLLSREYAVLGRPQPPLSVYITGPLELGWKQSGTWTANASGGSGSYTYEWRYRYNGTGSWSQVVGTSQTYTRTMLDTDFELQVKVTSNGQTVYDTHYVDYGIAKAAGQPITEDTSLPEDFTLSQNYPNPFNPETGIRFGLPEDSHVQVIIFDLLGREVRRLVDTDAATGYHSVVWDGRDDSGQSVASGVYLYQMSAGNYRMTKKLTIMR